MSKKSQLAKIAREIARCEECKKDKFGLPVPGEGNPNSKIMFIGMAPGFNESKTGKPFVGRAGKLLTQLLDSIGIKREKVFITSPVKYYPGRRNLKNKEIEHGRTHLMKQIEVIKPKYIVLLGDVAVKAVLNGQHLITKIHGKPIKRKPYVIFPTFHPAAGLRNPKVKIKIEKDMKKLRKLLK